MPIFTATAFTRSPATAKTTSVGLVASFDFPAILPVFVPTTMFVLMTALVPDAAEAVTLVPPVFGGSAFGAAFIGRVVTLASGTVRALVRYSVSISAVTDMPGRKAGSLSLTRMRTSNCVACCDWLLLLLLLVLFRLP